MKKPIRSITFLLVLFLLFLVSPVVQSEEFENGVARINVEKRTPDGDQGLGPFDITVTCANAGPFNFLLNGGESSSFGHPSRQELDCTISETLTSAQAEKFSYTAGDTVGADDGHIYAENVYDVHDETMYITNRLKSEPQPENGNSEPSFDPPMCTDIKPIDTPKLFEVKRNGASATVFFEPASDPVTSYVLSYGKTEAADEHTLSVPYGSSAGAIQLDIHDLDPDTEYFFKVRAMHNCMPGEWSVTSQTPKIQKEILPRAGR